MRRLLFERFTWVVAAACAVQLVVALLFHPGCLIIDEVTYHAMTRALVRTGSLALDNGWDVVASPELEWEHARAVANGDGSRLVAQYPYGFPLLIAPFYAAIGLRSFFVLNTLAFYGTILITRAIAFDVLRKRSLAIAAALVFALGTYAWEYSFAMWPHAVTLLLSTAAVLLSLRAAVDRALVRQLAAGALAGAATTMRLDAIFAMAAVLLVPVIVPRRRGGTFTPMAMGVVGLAPGIALLAVTNRVKFGAWQPLSYGPWHDAGSNTGLVTYLPLAAVGVAAIVAVSVLSPRAAAIRARHVAIVAAAAIVLVVAVPPLRAAAHRALDGLWMILLDLRHSDPDAVQSGLSHGPRGAMMYVGALKKAFVQSLPWLPLAAVAPLLRGTGAALRRRLVALAVPLFVHAAVFGALAWHGGLCLNLRYLLPALPFAAILATYTAYRLARRAPRVVRALRELDAIVLATIATWFVVAVLLVYPASISVREVFLLDAPLALAAALSVALLLASRSRWRGAASVALALALVAVVWAGMTALTYDAVATLRARWSNRRAAEAVRAVAPPRAFIFAEYPDLVSDAMEDGDVIVQPSRDRYASVAAIVAAATARGRPSYAILSERSYERLRAADRASTLRAGDPMATHGDLTVRRLEIAAP